MFDGESANLTTFLETLPPSKLSGLYKNQWTCQAVFRSLPAVAKQYVLRLLFVDQPVHQYLMDSWIRPQHAAKHTNAMETLRALQLFISSSDESGEITHKLHEAFQQNLRMAACGGGAMHASVPAEVLSCMPGETDLFRYAEEQWESLLLFLLKSRGAPPKPPDFTLRDKTPLPFDRLFQGAGLVGWSSNHSRGSITELGFRFLLMDVSSQLWKLIGQYVKEAEESMGSDLSEVVSFLLELAFRPMTQPGPCSELNPVQCRVASHMAQLGVMNIFKVDGEVWYVPTSLASCLCSSGSAGIEMGEHGGHIVVETNYRVYGYSKSPIQKAILELFSRCECMLPNLYVGVVTRDSIAHSLQCGIMAEQIVSYLQSHAHPKIRSRTPVVPEVVADQIRLWEKDVNRVATFDACMYDEFPSMEVYKKAVKYARNIGVYLWDDDKSKLIAKAVGHNDLKNYIKSIK